MSDNGARPPDDAAPALRLRDVRYDYPDGTVGLRGVDLDIAAGELVAVLGPNGAGKSTLMRLLNGLLRGDGTIDVFGTRLTDDSVRAIRSRVGLLFSNPDDQLFSPTVLDDVAYGPLHQGLDADEVLSRSRDALAQVGMAAYEDRTPHRLSLGEKKRVAIATVLSMRPDILVLDEPTSALAPAARHELIELLRELPQTQIIATHDMAMARELASHVVVLSDGRVVGNGPTEVVLGDSDLLREHDLEPALHGHAGPQRDSG
ncbi:MAG: ABC transporter ATP-binding protein [Chloroflexi bacterium]|nr:ABC transporter ATP-binding protein [Chloroflexota bacterium]